MPNVNIVVIISKADIRNSSSNGFTEIDKETFFGFHQKHIPLLVAKIAHIHRIRVSHKRIIPNICWLIQ